MHLTAIKTAVSNIITKGTTIMTHTERIKALLNGGTVDRPPFVAWGPHFNLEDKHTGDFTKAVIAYQNQHDFDILKVMMNGLYDTEDFGQVIAECENSDDPCFKKTVRSAFQSLDDWKNAKVTDIRQGAIAREIENIRILSEYYHGTVPILASIFSPYRMLGQLCGGYGGPGFFFEGNYIDFISAHESEYFEVMEVMTHQTINMMNGFLDAGAAGFFYCPGGTYEMDPSTREQYLKYIKPYDVRCLEAVKDKSWFTMAHLCGEPCCHMTDMLDLPVQALNWEDQSPTNPSIKEVRTMTDKILMGGIDRKRDFFGSNREKVKQQLRRKTLQAIEDAGGNLIISVGCESSREITHRFVVWHEVIDELASNGSLLV